MKLHRLASLPLVALAVGSGALIGCSPTPEPTPTPTPVFASEEEAFAAAEETYRAYNDAGNSTGDGMDFLTGAALEGELGTTRYLEENDLTLEGASSIESFTGIDTEVEFSTVVVKARVCVDVSNVVVLNASGDDVTPTDRVDLLTLDVTFVGTDAELLISESESAGEPAC